MPACDKAAFNLLACSPWISSKFVFPLMFRAVLLKLQGATQQQLRVSADTIGYLFPQVLLTTRSFIAHLAKREPFPVLFMYAHVHQRVLCLTCKVITTTTCFHFISVDGRSLLLYSTHS